jgi:BlaI family penicillinase repressor
MDDRFKFGKDKARNALALGELERQAMEALWEMGETPGNELFKEVGRKLGIRHNTLLTVFERLIGKGLVAKRKVGRVNFYRAIVTRDEFGALVAKPILEELLTVSSRSTLAAFVDNASRDPEKLRELKRLIEEAEKSENDDVNKPGGKG